MVLEPRLSNWQGYFLHKFPPAVVSSQPCLRDQQAKHLGTVLKLIVRTDPAFPERRSLFASCHPHGAGRHVCCYLFPPSGEAELEAGAWLASPEPPMASLGLLLPRS